MASKRHRIAIGLMSLVVLAGVAVALSVFRSPTRVRVASVDIHSQPESSFSKVVIQANHDLSNWIDHSGVQSAQRASNLAIARRIALGLVGSGLSLEEIRALESVPEDKQIQWVTNYLLQDRRWADYFAARFSRAMVGTDEGPFLLFRRRRFDSWLSDQFFEGVGYDSIVRSVVASEGLWTDTPQVNFITASMAEDDRRRCNAVVLTGRTSRTFLAQRIDCLQCHGDFVDQHDFGLNGDFVAGEQTHFHGLAAFFGTTGIRDNPFSGIRDVGGQYETQLLGDTEASAIEPQVPFYQELLPKEGKPRERLASWITDPKNHAFSRAAVNRVWALLFSRPLVAPVDSIPLGDDVPELLDTLAKDFAAHDFDMRRLVRVIINTDAFQRESRADFDVTSQHEDCYAVFPISQLRPDQVAGRMIQAGRLSAIDNDSSVFVRLARFGTENDFMRDFGDRGIDEFQSDAITITQRLVLMNGGIVAERTKNDFVGNAATRISRLVRDERQIADIVYLTVLGRHPNDAEQQTVIDYLAGKSGGAKTRAVGDLYWAMFNSTEFAWNN